jgi:hypothetical protein
MENQEKLIGDYLQYTKRYFTRKELLDIRQAIVDGDIIEIIAYKYKVGTKVIRYLFKDFIQTMDALRIPSGEYKLGHKDDSYYSEEEMLEGLPQYKWEDLDYYEKKFYLNYGRKYRKRYYPND